MSYTPVLSTCKNMTDHIARLFTQDNVSGSDFTRIPIADRRAFLNLARDYIARATHCLAGSWTFSTVAGTGYYAWSNIPDLIRTEYVLYGTTRLERVQNKEDFYYWRTVTTSGTPSRFYDDFGNNIWLFPPPDAVGAVTIYGSKFPTPFTGDSDAEVLPIRLRTAACYAAVANIYESLEVPDEIQARKYRDMAASIMEQEDSMMGDDRYFDSDQYEIPMGYSDAYTGPTT